MSTASTGAPVWIDRQRPQAHRGLRECARAAGPDRILVPGRTGPASSSLTQTRTRCGAGREHDRFSGVDRVDKGYIGAGIGILVPVRRPKGRSEQALHADTRTTNNLIRDIRALGERAAAELKQRWRTLQHVTLSPSRIGDIARAALVLNRIWK